MGTVGGEDLGDGTADHFDSLGKSKECENVRCFGYEGKLTGGDDDSDCGYFLRMWGSLSLGRTSASYSGVMVGGTPLPGLGGNC